MGEVILEESRLPENERLFNLTLRLIATDSWDVGPVGDQTAARFLHRNSFVVIPDASGEPR